MEANIFRCILERKKQGRERKRQSKSRVFMLLNGAEPTKREGFKANGHARDGKGLSQSNTTANNAEYRLNRVVATRNSAPITADPHTADNMGSTMRFALALFVARDLR